MEQKKPAGNSATGEEKVIGRWRPTKSQVLWAIGIMAALVTIVLLIGQLYAGLWENISTKRVAILVGIGLALTVLIILLALGGASRSWTGFAEKNLWDWLDLLSTLAVPIVIAAAGFWFTMQLNARQQSIEDQRAKREQVLAQQVAQDKALQTYLGQMSTLLLEKNLGSPDEASQVETKTLARARTLTVLGRLGPDRKRTVIEFLYEASLINGDDPILDLDKANLREANLRGVQLTNANLSSADLRGADLRDAILKYANLTGADLSEARVREASLKGADLRGAILKEAILSGVDLTKADLGESASLTNLSLFAADEAASFTTENEATPEKEDILSGINLSGANLYNAEGVTEEILEEQQARLGLATMPDGTGHNGQYFTVELDPSLTISVSDGWRLASSELSDELYITTDELDTYKWEGGEITITHPGYVFDPEAPIDPKEIPAPKNADGWVSWFQKHQKLVTSKPVPVRIGGFSGRQFDVTAKSKPDEFSAYYCGLPCVPLYPSGEGAIGIFPDYTKDRIIIVNVHGKTVLIDIASTPEHFDEFTSKAQEVLHTVEWKVAQARSSGEDPENSGAS